MFPIVFLLCWGRCSKLRFFHDLCLSLDWYLDLSIVNDESQVQILQRPRHCWVLASSRPKWKKRLLLIGSWTLSRAIRFTFYWKVLQMDEIMRHIGIYQHILGWTVKVKPQDPEPITEIILVVTGMLGFLEHPKSMCKKVCSLILLDLIFILWKEMLVNFWVVVGSELPFCQRCFVEILNKGGVVESFNLYIQISNIAVIHIYQICIHTVILRYSSGLSPSTGDCNLF